ncbi:MAG TPA: universal stress protein [Steroidobacteraceae bacterium]|nr:universal stress protein [Steroidobacteraceae bacterium]
MRHSTLANEFAGALIPQRRVLCASDLNPRSRAALQRAALVAQQMDAALVIVHAVPHSHSERELRSRCNRAYVRLLTHAEEVLGSSAESLNILVRSGDALDVISQAATEWNADLVVLAAPEPRRLDGITGTTAERIVRSTKRPVLVVHGSAQAHYRNVALAVDMSRASMPMVRRAVAFGVIDDADTAVVHAFEPPYHTLMHSSGIAPDQIERYKDGWTEELKSQLGATLAKSGVALSRARLVVRAVPAMTAIQDTLSDAATELLIIGASRWFFLKRLLIGSVADRLLRSVTCDVMVIPSERDEPLFDASAPTRGRIDHAVVP